MTLPNSETAPPDASGSADVQALALAGPRRPWLSLLKAVVVLSVITWLVWSGGIDFGNVLHTLSSPSWWASAFPLMLGGLLIVSLRWWVLLRAEGIHIPVADALRLCFIGHFWNNVLPGSVFGDVVKMFYIGRSAPSHRAEAYTTVVLDRVIGLAALVSIAFVAALANLGWIFEAGHEPIRKTFWAMVVCFALFFLGGGALVIGVGRGGRLAQVLRDRVPFLEPVRRGYHTLLRFGAMKRAIAITFGVSFVSHGLLVVNGMVCARALGETGLGAADYFFLVPVGLFVNSVPLGSPGGAGVGEGAFKLLFGSVGSPHGAGVMLLMRAAQLALGLPGLVLYLLMSRGSRAVIAKPYDREA